MNELKLYRRLQELSSQLNIATIAMYHGDKPATETLKTVRPIVDELKEIFDAMDAPAPEVITGA